MFGICRCALFPKATGAKDAMLGCDLIGYNPAILQLTNLLRAEQLVLEYFSCHEDLITGCGGITGVLVF
jgi:hypothetical protein